MYFILSTNFKATSHKTEYGGLLNLHVGRIFKFTCVTSQIYRIFLPSL